MDIVGQTLELESVKDTPQGVYLLTPNDEELLLPNKYVPSDLKIGDKVEVFIYTDSEDRPIATTLEPKIMLNKCAFLKCVDVNQYGAFFDWGMEKDLLVPFSEQFLRMTQIKIAKSRYNLSFLGDIYYKILDTRCPELKMNHRAVIHLDSVPMLILLTFILTS